MPAERASSAASASEYSRKASAAPISGGALSWILHPCPLPQGGRARTLVDGRTAVISFVSAAELRYGALRAGWGEFRLRRLARSLADLDVIQSDQRLIERSAELRAWASRTGHGLAHKIHEADRWVATPALALDLELVAGDRIFEGVPDLVFRGVSF